MAIVTCTGSLKVNYCGSGHPWSVGRIVEPIHNRLGTFEPVETEIVDFLDLESDAAC